MPDNLERDYKIALAVLSGQPVEQVATEYSITEVRVIQILKLKLRQASDKARVAGSLEGERQIYRDNILSRHEWSTVECLKHAEALKRLLDAINKT